MITLKLTSLIEEASRNKDEPQATSSGVMDKVTIVWKIVSSISEYLNLITTINLISQIYDEGNKTENRDKNSFSIAIIYLFMAISSQFLIAYSSTLYMLFYNGVYEPDYINRESCIVKSLRIAFLSFLGPLYFVIIELLNKIMQFFCLIGLMFGE